jgi:hypothetical protein
MQRARIGFPLAPKSLDIEPGSALDFSAFLSDAPAGKYGRLIVRSDGHFGFEKRPKAQRFYGVNLCFSANYLEHAEADALAERLMRLGYNTVRIHHYEGDLIDRKRPDSLTFRPEQLDKPGLPCRRAQKAGAVYQDRPIRFSPGQAFRDGLTEGGMDDFKDAVLVSKPAMNNWKAFSKKLLTHVNPYTNCLQRTNPRSLVSLINEPNLTNGRLGAWKPDLRAMFERDGKPGTPNGYPNKTVPELPKNMGDDRDRARRGGVLRVPAQARLRRDDRLFAQRHRHENTFDVPERLVGNPGIYGDPRFVRLRGQPFLLGSSELSGRVVGPALDRRER